MAPALQGWQSGKEKEVTLLFFPHSFSMRGGKPVSRSQGFGRQEMFLEGPFLVFPSRQKQAENLAAEVAVSLKGSASPAPPAKGEGLDFGNRLFSLGWCPAPQAAIKQPRRLFPAPSPPPLRAELIQRWLKELD